MSAITDFRDLQDWTPNEIKSLAMTPVSSFLGKPLSQCGTMWLGPDVQESTGPVDESLTYSSGRDLYIERQLSGNAQSTTINIAGVMSGVPNLFDDLTLKLSPGVGLSVQASITNAAAGLQNVVIAGIWIRANADPALGPTLMLKRTQLDLDFSGTTNIITTPWVTHGIDGALAAQGFEFAGIVMYSSSGEFVNQKIRGLDQYSNRYFGGWRIALWNNAGLGQNVSITYKGSMTGVATGSIAAYIVSQPLNALSDSDWAALKRAFARGSLTRVAWGIKSMLTTASASAVHAAGLRAGFFDDIGNFAKNVGQTVGHVVNTVGQVANAAGHVAGALHLRGGRVGPSVHAAGMRSAGMQAAGMQAAGMYGYE